MLSDDPAIAEEAVDVDLNIVGLEDVCVFDLVVGLEDVEGLEVDIDL